MLRFWAVALLALVPIIFVDAPAVGGGKAEKDIRFEGKLTKDDPKDRRRNGAFKAHVVKMKAGSTYTIDMVSAQFDSYLFLEDMAGKELAMDDDSGGMLNARIIFNCEKDADYKIVCTSFGADAVGDFVLTVKKSGVAPKLSTPHSALVGKAAPDFQGDFALNGKAGKLSDLHGKVVLLNFWNVASLPCATTFPRLRAWHKDHKAAGLEVVGVTYYHFELGQFLGFDKAEGKLTKLDEATKQTEQAMLKEFAAHHQLTYPLVVLSREEALKAFNAFYVNGVPQWVLIDRKGVVRLIGVGEGEAATTALHTEIKKVLAEK